MTFFNRKLVSNIIHNGKKFLVNSKYMEGNPTCLTVKTENAEQTFKIKCMTQFSSCKNIAIDWGDGIQVTYEYDDTTRVHDVSHTYSAAGEYDILISNTVSKLEVVDVSDDFSDNDVKSKYAVLKLKQLGSNVKELGEECFLGAANMVEANFENSELATIGNSAFNGTALSSVNIPSSVTAVGKDAFANCINLKSLTIDGKNIKNFSEGVCKYDYALKYVDLPYAIDDNAESAFCCIGAFTPDTVKNPYAVDLSIPDGWKSIPKNCFAGMPQLSSCIVPNSVTSILLGAFADAKDIYEIEEDGVSVSYSPCVNGLQKLVFTGNSIYNVLKAFKATLKNTFSTVGSIDSEYNDSTARSYCYNEAVEKALANCIEPKIDLTFLNDSMQEYLYWKSPCCNKTVDEVMSALVKYTNYFNTFATTSCLYAITWDIHTTTSRQFWGDTETFDVARYTIEATDLDSLKNSNEVIVSGLVYTPLPTVLTIEDPDAPEDPETHERRPKEISVYNSKMFTAADLHLLQNDVIDIDFGKYSTLSIGDNALCGCTKLRSVYIPATVTYIGKNAFADIATLREVQFKRSRSVFVDEGAFKNTPALTAFASEYDKVEINAAEFMQFAEENPTDSFKNCGIIANANFPDATEVKAGFAGSNIKMLSYPKARHISADNAFNNTNSLKYLSIPCVSSFAAENAFYGRNDNTHLSIDMRQYSNNAVPELNDTFFKNSNSTYLSNFSIYVSRKMYGDWAASQNWNKFNGVFEYTEYETPDYMACNIRESLSTTSRVDRANLPYILFRTSGLDDNKHDKITRVAVQTASDGGSGGHLPVYENLKLVALLADSVRVESLPINYDGSYNTKLEFIFNEPIPADRTQVIEFLFYNNSSRISNMRIVMVDAAEWSEFNSIIGPMAGGFIPAIDIQATRTNGIKSYIKNPTAALFNEYAFEDTVIILNKEKIGSDIVWSLNGEAFEPKYGEVDTETSKKQIVFKYTRGLIVPDISSNLSYLKFTDGTTVEANFNGLLTRAMLAQAMLAEKELSYIKVGDNVVGIDSDAFAGNYFLKTIILPDRLSLLPANIFNGCNSLNAVFIGESLTAINEQTFANCYMLSSLYIPLSVSSLAEGGQQLANTGICEISLPDGIMTIPDQAFANSTLLTSILFGKKLSSINDSAFVNCASLMSVEIPGSIKNIGNYAFKMCSLLKTVSLRDSVEVPSVTANAFDYTPDDLSIYVTDNMYNAFCDAEEWCNISVKIFADNYPANNTYIGNTTFRISTITNAEVAAATAPTTLSTGILATSIAENAFLCCLQLTAAYINNRISSIGENAFASCENLQIATIPRTIAGNLSTAGHSYIFKDCKKLATVEIAEGVKHIANGMFYNSGLTSIALPNTLTGIGEYAFYGCKNILSLTIPASVRSIGRYAFAEAGITLFDCIDLSKACDPSFITLNAFDVIDDDFKIYVDPSLLQTWQNALSTISSHICIDPRLTTIKYRNGETKHELIEDNLVVNDLSSPADILSIHVGTAVTSITQNSSSSKTILENILSIEIDEGCQIIGDNVFNAASALTSVYLPSTIQLVGTSAFKDCNLSTVTIADGVVNLSIESNAFDSNIDTFTFGFGTYTIDGNLVSEGKTFINAVINYEEDTTDQAKQRFNLFDYINATLPIEYVKIENLDYGPLCFKATIRNSQVYLKASSTNVLSADDGIHLIYSTDNKNTWKDYNWNGKTGEVITVENDNDKVFFRARNYNETLSRSTIDYISFITIGRFEVYGNILTLLHCTGNKTDVPTYCFFRLFLNCNITTAPSLPAIQLNECCYSEMFANCTLLKSAPSLPATAMAPFCYADMFNCCLSLSKAPALNSILLAEGCYARMFKACKSLTAAPNLLAEHLYKDCYLAMFNGCDNITTTPMLANPETYDLFDVAAEVAEITMPIFAEYDSKQKKINVFYYENTEVESEIVPVKTVVKEIDMSYVTDGIVANVEYNAESKTIVATVNYAAENCYTNMFTNCINLQSATLLFMNIMPNAGLTNYGAWMDNVAAVGTILLPANSTASLLIPAGWTRVDIDE